MHERRHVHELDRDPGRDRRLAGSGEEAEQRPQPLAAGRERLVGDLTRQARRARSTACASPASTSAMYAARPGVAWTARQRHAATPVWTATIEPREQPELDVARNRPPRAAARDLRPRGTASPMRAGRCRRCRRAAPCRAAGRSGRTRARRTASRAPRGCVISRIASRPPGGSTRRSSRSASGRSATFRTPKPTVAASNDPSANGSASMSPCTHSTRRCLLPGPREHPLGEVEPRHATRARAQVGDREVAGAAGRVEHAVARPHDERGRQPAPAPVEARRSSGGSSRRRPARSGRTSSAPRRARASRACPQRETSAFSTPSWSRIRPTTKSTRSSTELAPW